MQAREAEVAAAARAAEAAASAESAGAATRTGGRFGGPKPVRYDEAGLPIYTEEQLGIGSGGGDTKDCPFDCWCCF